MDFSSSFDALLNQAKQLQLKKWQNLLQKYRQTIDDFKQAEVRSGIAYQALQPNLLSYAHEKDEEPWGFYCANEVFPSWDQAGKVESLPIIYSFTSYAATALDAAFQPSLLNYALRAILSYPLSRSHIYMLDVDYNGPFNRLSPICTDLDDTGDKNFYHYITNSRDQERLLDLLEDSVEHNTRTCLSQYASISDYNKANQGIEVPYRFVFIHDIGRVFSEAQIHRLYRLVYRSNASKAGVYIFFTYNASGLPQGILSKALADLLSESNCFQVGAGYRLSEQAKIDLELEASQQFISALISYIQGQKVQGQTFDFKKQIESMLSGKRLWSNLPVGYDYSYIDMPVGYASPSQVQGLKFQFKESPHMFIGGKTGSGKSILLHNIVLNAALRYSPDYLRLYLVDMKSGVSMIPYKDLPHAEVVSASSDRAYALSVLQRAVALSEERGNAFKALGVTNLWDANALLVSRGKKPYYALLVILDEYQELVKDNNTVSNEARRCIEYLHKKGRSQGIALGLCTQSLGGVSTDISQVRLKLSLLTNASDSQKLLGNDAACRLGSRKGRAILNLSEDGDAKYNKEFQVAFIDEQKDLPRYIQEIARLYKLQGGEELPSLLYDENNLEASLSNNVALQDGVRSRHKKPHIYVGMPLVCREEHNSFYFHRDAKSHVGVVGNDRVTAMRLTGSIILQFLAIYPNSLACVCDMQSANASTVDSLSLLQKHPNVRYQKESDFEKGLKAIYGELMQREQNYSEAARRPEMLYVLIDLRPIPPLRQKPSFGASGFGFGPSSTTNGTSHPVPKDMLDAILERGPELGIHLLTYAYNTSNLLDVNDQIKQFMEVKIGLRGGDARRFVEGYGDEELVDCMGLARLRVPDEMGASSPQGELFLPYTNTGYPNNRAYSLWEGVLSITSN